MAVSHQHRDANGLDTERDLLSTHSVVREQGVRTDLREKYLGAWFYDPSLLSGRTNFITQFSRTLITYQKYNVNIHNLCAGNFRVRTSSHILTIPRRQN